VAVAARRVRLSRLRIITAAVAVADAEGVDAITMRRIAEAVDAHPTSIYNHLPSKEAILDGVVERLFEEAAIPASFPDWRDWIRAFATALRGIARRHPGAFQVLLRRSAEGPVAATQTEAALEAFRRAGVSPTTAAHTVTATALAIFGLALNECRPSEATVLRDISHLTPDRYPRYLESVATLGDDTSGAWELLVETLIAGLDVRLAIAGSR